MLIDDDVCYRALLARDARFDGRFFVGVLTTGIYCRPVCPARTPHRRNVTFFGSAAAAVAAGLRACRRCRPETAPGSRDWDHRSDFVARALRLIGGGAADADGTGAVARELHVTERHLNRALVSEVGTTAGRLARTRRAQTARLLLENTDLRLSEVAFAAGFRTVRQFNEVMREHFGATPSELRRTPAEEDDRPGRPIAGVTVRLRFRPPYPRGSVLGWLARHAVPGVDEVDVAAGVVRTTTPDGGAIEARFEETSVVVDLGSGEGTDVRDVLQRIAAVRRWLDLDASPAEIDGHLGREPLLSRYVDRTPGLRVPGALDPFRTLTGTIVSQQVSVRAAATQNARLVEFMRAPGRFPTAAELAVADPGLLAAALGVPRARGRTLVETAAAVASGSVALGPQADRAATLASLGRIKGIGPWTLADLRMRALGDPDVWPAGDLILRRAVSSGGRFAGLDPAACSPWQSYLAHHIWVANSEPTEEAQAVIAGRTAS